MEKILDFFKKQTPLKIGVEVLVLIFIIILIFGIGIYKFKWDSKVTKATASIVPYPAAILDYSSLITVGEFNSELDSIKQYYKEAQGLDFSTKEDKEKLSKIRNALLDQLIENEIIQKEAKKLGITVSQDEVNQEYNKLSEANQGEEKLKEQLKKYYNWDVSTFKEKIKMNLLGEKLEKKVSEDESFNAEAKKRASELLFQAKAGTNFEELARKSSEDALSASKGGDLGYIAKGTRVLEFEKAAYSLKKGEIYPEIVKTYEGYHILKCTDIKEGQPKISQILVKTKSFFDWLSEKKKEAKIWRFLTP